MTNRQIEDAAPEHIPANAPQMAKTPPAIAADRGCERCRRDSAWGDALSRNDDERQWRGLIKHLPENARQIWAALNDLHQFWLVLQDFGGQSIRVPRNLPKDKGHSLRKKLGVACLRKLMAVFGGTSLYVPRCSALKNRLRQRDITRDFSRSTRRGASSTAAVSSLARQHGISDRRVWQILKKENSVPPQTRLLMKLGDSARPATDRPDASH